MNEYNIYYIIIYDVLHGSKKNIYIYMFNDHVSSV
jgi:hypothetical protein